MFSNRTRLFICIIFLLSLVILADKRMYELASLALMFIVLLGWDYIRQGTLVVAARYFHHKDYENAERSLLEIL